MILEPFDLSNTARSVYDIGIFERVKGVFRGSYLLLHETFDLGMLFTTPMFVPQRQTQHYNNNPPSPNTAKNDFNNAEGGFAQTNRQPELRRSPPNIRHDDFEKFSTEQRDNTSRRNGYRDFGRDKNENQTYESNRQRPYNHRPPSFAKA